MSVLTTNQSNIEMRDAEDLEQGDIFVRHEFHYGSLRTRAFKVLEVMTSHSLSTGLRVCNINVEILAADLTSSIEARFLPMDPAPVVTEWLDMDAWDTVAVVVGS
jgi:hypothetical protein